MSFFINLGMRKKVYLVTVLIATAVLSVIGIVYERYETAAYEGWENRLQASASVANDLVSKVASDTHVNLMPEHKRRMICRALASAGDKESNSFLIFDSDLKAIDCQGGAVETWTHDVSLRQSPEFLTFLKDGIENGEAVAEFQEIAIADSIVSDQLFYGIKNPEWNWLIVSRLDITEMNEKVRQTFVTVVTLTAVGFFFCLFLMLLLAKSTSGPLIKTMVMIEQLENGRFDHRLKLSRNDEIGQMAMTMDRFANDLEHNIVNAIDKLAHGDLNLGIQAHDKDDRLRCSLIKLEKDLSRMLIAIQSVAGVISTESESVSQFAQSLAEGTTESAASLEEISSSLDQLSTQIKTNAENASLINNLSNEAQDRAEAGNEKMQELVTAMSAIKASGQSVEKIIKVIDEIAFQTNLLALNAAVEAARAGQHGKGFAVVAEEVRNLAVRSASAASETAELISGSVTKTQYGSEVAAQTEKELAEILTSVSKVSALAGEIATSSREQANGVSQINYGVQQIDQVVQGQTATAEESAEAAQELSGQALELIALLNEFKLNDVRADGIEEPRIELRGAEKCESRLISMGHSAITNYGREDILSGGERG